MKILFLFLLSLSLKVLAHGENNPGPHGGVIRMPGAFHTELLVKGGTARIWLLDVNFKNPTTQNSTLSVKADGGEVHCMNKKDHFECHLTEKQQKSAELKLKALRSGVSGKEIIYPLSGLASDEHSQHH